MNFNRREVLKGLAIAPGLFPAEVWGQCRVGGIVSPRQSETAGGVDWSTLDLVAEFGAIGDGNADNSEAFARFGAAARALSKAGRGVRLVLAPGQYQYDAKKCFGFLFDIRRLHVSAYGASVQNTYDTAVANSNYEFPWPQIHSYLGADYVLNDEGALIEAAAIGDCRIILQSRPLTNDFPPGSYVLIASLNIQYMGYPHNCDRFDYAVVLESDASTGMLVLDRPLSYNHQTDFPELYSKAYCSGPHVGRARVWNMNKYELHDVEHLTEGLVIKPIAHKLHGYQDIFHGTGRQQIYRDCTFPGYGASNIELFRMENCVVHGHGEIDKLINDVVIENCEFNGGLNFQSSSVERVSIRNTKIRDKKNIASLYTGTAKSIEIDRCEVETLSEGLILGLNRSLSVTDSVIKKWGAGLEPYGQYGDMSGPLLDIDGVNNWFADGVFTFTNFSQSIRRNQALIYNVLPGAQINLAGPNLGLGPMLTGPSGTGIVSSIREVDGAFVVTTDLPYRQLPAWCPNKFRIQRCGELRIASSRGCDLVETASRAHVLGLRPFEYIHRDFSREKSRSGAIMVAGTPKRFVFDVRRAGLAGQSMTLDFSHCLDEATCRDAGRLAITIDLAVAGQRNFSVSGLAGAAGGDKVMLAGAAQTTLPPNKWFYQNAFWSFTQDLARLGGADRPHLELSLKMEMGRFRTIAPPLNSRG